MSALDDGPQIVVPLTSILDGSGSAASSQPWTFYLTVIGEQAQIALRHLLSIWEMEGDSADLDVWSRRDLIDESLVWSHLQGAMFAGIVLARMFDPRIPAAGRKATGGERTRHERRRNQANQRATQLRGLLNIEDGSPLLQIRKVRDALEHFDERVDDLVLAGDIASVSDFTISLGGQIREAPDDVVPQPERGHSRHVVMRQFAPDLGLLYFGDEFVDLFAYEAALHDLLASMVDAHAKMSSTSTGSLLFGKSQVFRWRDGQVAERRSAIEELRNEVRDAGHWLLRPSQRPRTVIAVHTLQPASAPE